MTWFMVAISMTAVVTDIRRREIPNWLTFGGMLLGLVVNAIWGSIYTWLVGVVVWTVAAILMWRLEWFGGGDMKFLIASAAIMGGEWTVYMFYRSLLCSIPIFLLYMAASRKVKVSVPYALPLAGGVLWEILWPLEGEGF